jgi:predicted nucleic acid-binding protein
MKVLLDTNIIMDALQERSPFDVEAKEILKLAQDKYKLTCLFTANASADIFYLYSKARDVKSAKAALGFLLAHYTVVSVTHEDCSAALSFSVDDYEDALAAICAEKAEADYIITRDEKFLKANLEVSAITPKALVDMLAEKNNDSLLTMAL